MSRETIEWLNNNTLIGFTENRGAAWHGRAGDDNHYPGAIPVEDVEKRLFDWEPEERPVYVGQPFVIGGGHMPVLDGTRKAIVHPRTDHTFGIFSQTFEIHYYRQWLLENISVILGDDLAIGTAGLLRQGGQAWVQVEVPETVIGPGDVHFRPFLLASTSLDGSLSSSYGRSVTNTVCDNTMAIAMGEGTRLRFKHRKGEKGIQGKVQDVRAALDIVFTAADDFSKQLEALLGTHVSDSLFTSIVVDQVPLPEDPKKAAGAATIARQKRVALHELYHDDERVAPWQGNAYGVWQAFNTYAQHESKIQKATVRAERNARMLVDGRQEKADYAILEKILVMAS